MATEAIDKGVCRSCDAVVGGVCAGLAERLDVDPIVVRILALFIALLTAGLGVIVYAVLWARLPRGDESAIPYEVTPEHAESSMYGNVDCETGRAAGARTRKEGGISFLARLSIAVGLMLLFLLVATNIAPLVAGTEWWQFWPIALIIVGLCLIVIPVPTRYEAVWHALGIVVTSAAATLLPITLNMMSWETLPFAFSRAWILLVLAVVIFAIGLIRQSDTLVVTAAFFIVAFFVFALVACAVPGDAQSLLLHMPDGRLIKIAISGF